MPELPEVEVTRLALNAASQGQEISGCKVYQRQLRYPVTRGFASAMAGNRIRDWSRRSKYLVGHLEYGRLLIHLGMSGKMTFGPKRRRREKHDHIVWTLGNGLALHFNDPRRFGCALYADDGHFWLLDGIGPEPLGRHFDGASLLRHCQKSERAIKSCLLDQRLVAGLGNIYVCEALHLSEIHPLTPASRLGDDDYARLARAIKRVLRRALKAGGTTLRDFAYGEGSPGYFAIELAVYGREGQPCPQCGHPVARIIIAQRSSYYCPECQPGLKPRRGAKGTRR